VSELYKLIGEPEAQQTASETDEMDDALFTLNASLFSSRLLLDTVATPLVRLSLTCANIKHKSPSASIFFAHTSAT
jgi:hypothetical protein